MNKTDVKVLKLTETNYDMWTEMMSYLFDSNGGYKYINELIPIADIEEQAEREIFTNTAMLIVVHVHSDLQNLICSDRSDPNSCNPYTLWHKLENHFNPQPSPITHTPQNFVLCAGHGRFWINWSICPTDQIHCREAEFSHRKNKLVENVVSPNMSDISEKLREKFSLSLVCILLIDLILLDLLLPSSSSSSSSSASPLFITPRESKFKSRWEQDPTEIRNSLFYYFKNHFDISKTFLKELGFELAGYVSDDDKLSVLLVGVKANYEIMYNHLVGREHLTFQSASEYLIQHATDSCSDTINQMEEKKRHNPDKFPKEDSSRRDVDKTEETLPKVWKETPAACLL